MRRAFVGVVAVAAAIAGAAAANIGDLAAQDRASSEVDLTRDRLVDLTHPFNRRTIYWPPARRFRLPKVAEGDAEGGHF